MSLTDLLSPAGLSSLSDLAPAFAIGLAGGALYFAGLWWTVRRLADRRLPTAGLITSWLIRVLVLMGALYWAMDASAQRLPALLSAVAGVLVARTVILRRVRAISGDAHSGFHRPGQRSINRPGTEH